MTLRWAFLVDSVPFTPAVVNGETSLGGSESSCLGVARALQAMGQQVHVFATKLDPAAEGLDAAGVQWHHMEDFPAWSGPFHWDVVVALRMPAAFQGDVRARLRLLWNQDLMSAEAFKSMVMAVAWNVDQLVYVSEFMRAQWEDWLPELAGRGWVTRNGYDPAHVPTDVTKDPNRIIYISRPERGLKPLLAMWPAFKQAHPHAELAICRYSSMYDAQGWGAVCATFDEAAQRVHDTVGGITWLGELNKAQLYRAIAESAVMWYPGVSDFAETSCIAAIEAQACGTPFVGSYKGALPETVPTGYLIRGDVSSPEYQRDSMAAVADLMDGCRTQSKRYRVLQREGRAHVASYTYARLAQDWLTHVEDVFRQRYEANPLGVLRALVHEDDLVTAQHVAREIIEEGERNGLAPEMADIDTLHDRYREALEGDALCNRVARGEEHTADDYADRSLNPLDEIKMGARIPSVVAALAGCSHVLDVACGNGAFAIALAQTYPEMRITAVDYAPGNIEKGRAAAETVGVADRITWVEAPAWDFALQQPSAWLAAQPDGVYDGLWVGEFIEHIADCSGFVDALERVAHPGAMVVYTCPSGPMGVEWSDPKRPMRRSHVHHFTHEDIHAVFGRKQDVAVQYVDGEVSPAGSRIGAWQITYRVSDARAGQRKLEERALKTRPRQRLTVGILAHNAEHDLGRCLQSVWAIADEIVIGNTGSGDDTRRIAESFGRNIRVLDLPRVETFEEGFAGARNAVLRAATGEWFLWIDTDEILVGAASLRMYLEAGAPYLGFSIKQNHFQLDAPSHFDQPIRVFRTDQPIQFYGCVHEQPQMGDCNGEIHPALQLEDVQIAHFGYLTTGVRMAKALNRNLPLLQRDQRVFPDRRLGKVLMVREWVQQGEILLAQSQRMTKPAQQCFVQAVGLYRLHFADPADMYHALVRPFYERALQALGVGTEVAFALAGKPGGLGTSRVTPARIWVADPEELDRYVRYQVTQALSRMVPPAVRVDPLPVPDVEGVAV